MKTRRYTLPAGRLSKKERERQLVDAVEQMTAVNGYPPTMREMAKRMGVSLTRIAQLMAACEQQGFITKVPGISRTYRVVH